METKETTFKGFKMSGFIALVLVALEIAGIVSSVVFVYHVVWLVPVLGVLVLLTLFGLMMLEPNEAKAMMFFGKYCGTFYNTGFWWVNPFYTVKNVSLRARNLNAQPIKVNDKAGNPIMIGLVLVWKVKDVYKSLFDIDSQSIAQSSASAVGNSIKRMNAFEDFVSVQSDAALRQVAGMYAYDENGSATGSELTLRSGADEINEFLTSKLNERLLMAGIEIVEARINYLAYAPEIAAVMLRRQQADAIIAAREKIVEGAVSMVKMALEHLEDDKIVEFDEDKKASMVSNLLVVLCADESAQPVINTGTLNQ